LIAEEQMVKEKRAGEYPKLIQTWVTDEQYHAIMRIAGNIGTISSVVRVLLDEALKSRATTDAAKAQ
jgi:hypothetical protein